MDIKIESKTDVMGSVLKLMRAMRRHPVRPEHEFPPAVGRLLALRTNDGSSPAELCELMDVRPSSMSELLSKMEENGLVTRATDEADRRATKVWLNENGKEATERMEAKFRAENEKLAACFSAEVAEQFCALCEKLSEHLEGLPEKEDHTTVPAAAMDITDIMVRTGITGSAVPENRILNSCN